NETNEASAHRGSLTTIAARLPIASAESVAIHSRSWRLGCDCYATACHHLHGGWTHSKGEELVLLDSLFSATREGWVCRPMQITVTIRLPTARGEQDWRTHRE